jgi:hypothetical protein
MKSLIALAAVFAALALAAPAGARPLIDPPLTPHASPSTPTVAPSPADASDGVSFLVVAIVGAAAFFTGAGAARVVSVPRRQGQNA